MKLYKDTKGRFLTQSLFLEQSQLQYKTDFTPPFTLKEYDHELNGKKYISMRRLYLEISDPTEYQFAKQVLGSWDHWIALCKTKWFKEIIKSWREELEVKLRSEGIKIQIETALDPKNKSSAVSARWLAEKGWDLDNKLSKKQKADKDRDKKISTRVNTSIENDMERLGLKVVKNG